jgi:hypothetical protein
MPQSSSGDESPDDRDYKVRVSVACLPACCTCLHVSSPHAHLLALLCVSQRLLGKSARKGTRSSLRSPAPSESNGRTPESSAKAELDNIAVGGGGLADPGAPGYIEPGSTPDKSVHDKIRLFHQRSAQGHPHKELFAGQQSNNIGEEVGQKRRSDMSVASAGPRKPPVPRQVEELVRQSRADAAMVRRRGVRQVKSRGSSADAKEASSDNSEHGASGSAAVLSDSASQGKNNSAAPERSRSRSPHTKDANGAGGNELAAGECLVASPRPPKWMCRVVVTAVEVRDVPRIAGEVMTDCGCRVSLRAPGAVPVSSCTRMLRCSGHDKGVKWKERMVFGVQEDLTGSATLVVELVGSGVSNPSKQVTFGAVRELRVADLLNQVQVLGLRV